LRRLAITESLARVGELLLQFLYLRAGLLDFALALEMRPVSNCRPRRRWRCFGSMGANLLHELVQPINLTANFAANLAGAVDIEKRCGWVSPSRTIDSLNRTTIAGRSPARFAMPNVRVKIASGL
jgi:hypothetical protein